MRSACKECIHEKKCSNAGENTIGCSRFRTTEETVPIGKVAKYLAKKRCVVWKLGRRCDGDCVEHWITTLRGMK